MSNLLAIAIADYGCSLVIGAIFGVLQWLRAKRPPYGVVIYKKMIQAPLASAHALAWHVYRQHTTSPCLLVYQAPIGARDSALFAGLQQLLLKGRSGMS